MLELTHQYVLFDRDRSTKFTLRKENTHGGGCNHPTADPSVLEQHDGGSPSASRVAGRRAQVGYRRDRDGFVEDRHIRDRKPLVGDG